MGLVEKFEIELRESQAKVSAAKEFPDLEEIKDRWGILRLTTKTVNEKAVNFEVRPECDCCNKVTLYALPYIEHEGIRLYSKKVAVSFAKKITKTKVYYVHEGDWDETAEWQDFNGPLLDKIAEWLDEHDADPY